MTNTTIPAPPAYVPFPKVPRLNREIIVTEKIDGTNGQVNGRVSVAIGIDELVHETLHAIAVQRRPSIPARRQVAVRRRPIMSVIAEDTKFMLTMMLVTVAGTLLCALGG